ncbi:MAG: fatty acid desaturase CarF family protein [Elusimicrobiota bacterium]|nr:fatty acid desaturase CarF family protein [Elusimicrobiota bacterium]
MDLETKRKQFNSAMELYEGRRIYRVFGWFIAAANISLQVLLLVRALELSIGPARQLAALAAAYLLTDFLNGLVHLYTDNIDNYAWLGGPLIANFHLHHKTPRYIDRGLAAVYFFETGSKVWLVPFLCAVVLLSYQPGLNPVLLYALVYTGILSSVAEVSHYLAHNSLSPAAAFLARAGLLLPKRRHARHHIEDNAGYTFLNGFTDPLVDLIARKYYTGYKNGTDLHYSKYITPAAR